MHSVLILHLKKMGDEQPTGGSEIKPALENHMKYQASLIATENLGNLFPCLPVLRVKKLLFISKLNLFQFNLCPMSLILLSCISVKTLRPSSWCPPCRYRACSGLPRTVFSAGWQSPAASVCPQKSSVSALSILFILHWNFSELLMPFLYLGTQNWHGILDVVCWVLRRSGHLHHSAGCAPAQQPRVPLALPAAFGQKWQTECSRLCSRSH